MPLWKPDACGPSDRRGPKGDVTQVGETGKVNPSGAGNARACGPKLAITDQTRIDRAILDTEISPMLPGMPHITSNPSALSQAMSQFLCETCGTLYPDAEIPPEHCPICEDERQFVPASGQAWITREKLAATHRNAWRRHECGLFSIQTVPTFAINQRAFLLRTPQGNILWDCIALLDSATEELVRGLGGVHAIAISHPHYYATMQEWAAAFSAPIYLHAADRQWVMRSAAAIRFWEGGTLDIAPGVTLVRAGGHFPGGTVLHWQGTADGKGALLVGDIVQVSPGARRVSFMWSYPNLMPLPASAIRSVAACLAPLEYDRIYGAFLGQEVLCHGPAIVARSATRYAELLGGPGTVRQDPTGALGARGSEPAVEDRSI